MKQRVLVPQGKIWYLGTQDTSLQSPKPKHTTIALDAGFDLDVPDDDIYPIDYASRLRKSMTAAQAESIYVTYHTTSKPFPGASTAQTPEQKLVEVFNALKRASDVNRMSDFDYDFNTNSVTINKRAVVFNGRVPIPYKIMGVAGSFTATCNSIEDVGNLPLTVGGDITLKLETNTHLDMSRWVFKEAKSLYIAGTVQDRFNISFVPGANVESLTVISARLKDLRNLSRLTVTSGRMVIGAKTDRLSLGGLPENLNELELNGAIPRLDILPMLMMRNPPKSVMGLRDSDLITQALQTIANMPKAQRILAIKRELPLARLIRRGK